MRCCRAIRLSASQARAVMEEYTGPQYEIEKHSTVSNAMSIFTKTVVVF